MDLQAYYHQGLFGTWNLEAILAIVPVLFLGQMLRLLGLLVVPYFILFRWFRGFFRRYKTRPDPGEPKLY